jgi:hypothetical protein
MATYTITNLVTEKGPSQPVQLRYATYYDAADGAGLSRVWGGIHPNADNAAGRRAGAEVGKTVWNLVKRYWDRSVTNTPVTITRRSPVEVEVRYAALRGIYYDLQTATNVAGPFTSLGSSIAQPFDAVSVAQTNVCDETQRYYKVVGRLTP